MKTNCWLQLILYSHLTQEFYKVKYEIKSKYIYTQNSRVPKTAILNLTFICMIQNPKRWECFQQKKLMNTIWHVRWLLLSLLLSSSSSFSLLSESLSLSLLTLLSLVMIIDDERKTGVEDKSVSFVSSIVRSCFKCVSLLSMKNIQSLKDTTCEIWRISDVGCTFHVFSMFSFLVDKTAMCRSYLPKHFERHPSLLAVEKTKYL